MGRVSLGPFSRSRGALEPAFQPQHTPEISYVLSGPPLYDPVRLSTIRQGLSNTLRASTTPEKVTLLHPPATTCLPHGRPCPPRPPGTVVNRPVSYRQ